MSRLDGGRNFLMAAALALGVAACDSPIAPPAHGEPVGAEVYLRGTTQLLADVHGDHWDGSITLDLAEEIAVDVRFLDANDNIIPLGGEYTVRAEIASGYPTDLVELLDHGDHVDIEALAAGETRIVLHLWHGGHSDWASPALPVVVNP